MKENKNEESKEIARAGSSGNSKETDFAAKKTDFAAGKQAGKQTSGDAKSSDEVQAREERAEGEVRADGEKPSTEELPRKEKSRKFKAFFKKKAVRAVSCVLALFCAFFGGFFTHKATLPKEINSLLWAKERIQKDYLYEISDEEFYNAVFLGVNSLLDRYSAYLTADENAAAVKKSTGEYSGLGLYFVSATADSENGVTISRTAGGSPAEAAGIADGSRITAYGASADENSMTRFTSLANFAEFTAKYAANEVFYVRETRYPYDENCSRIVPLHKATFTENYVTYRSETSAYVYLGSEARETEKLAEGGGAFALSALPEDTAYIRLTQFNGNAAAEFDGAMNRFKSDGKTRLVLDLRGNGGGDMEILRSIASYFCKNTADKKPAAAVAVYRDGKSYVFKAKQNLYSEYFGENGKVYVLADEGTASASECLLGTMLDYGAAAYENVCLTAGADGVAKTYGKGIMQTTVSRFVWRSEAIKLTSAKICWPVSGKCIHDRGIIAADGCKSVAQNYAPDGEISAALGALGMIAE